MRSQLRPASSRAESPAATSADRTEAGEEHVRRTALADDGFERVDARLRQRCRERLVVDDEDRRRAVGAGLGGGVAHAAPEHDAEDVASQRHGLREDAEATLGEVSVVCLEVDEGAHTTR